MIQLRFDSTKELFDFILYTPDLMHWNILECNLTTNDGTINDYNIYIHRNVRDGSEIVCLNDENIKEKFMRVADDVKTNKYRGIKFDILLQISIDFKNSIDIFDHFYDFYLCLYSNDDVIICSTHFYERNKDHGIQPIIAFDTYIVQLYNEWKNSKILQN